MRAIDDARWRKVKDSLSPFGLDADAVMVTTGLKTAQPLPLRDALEELALEIAFSRPRQRRTPKQRADAQRETLAAIEALLGAFNYSSMGLAYIDTVTAQEELEALAAKLRAQIAKLDAAGSNRRDNARKRTRNEYWEECAQLLGPIAPRPVKPKELIRFLLACSPFPTTDSAVEMFVYRCKRTT
jgi:hypothetical protein